MLDDAERNLALAAKLAPAELDAWFTAHAAGFKVVLDWVANHTGWDNKWITAHPDWYTKDEKGQITVPPGTDWTDVADLTEERAREGWI